MSTHETKELDMPSRSRRIRFAGFLLMFGVGLATPVVALALSEASDSARSDAVSTGSLDASKREEEIARIQEELGITPVLSADQKGVPEEKRSAMEHPALGILPPADAMSEHPWASFSDRGDRAMVDRVRAAALDLIVADKRATIITPSEAEAAQTALSRGHEVAAVAEMADALARIERMKASVWVPELSTQQGLDARNGVLAQLSYGWLTGYKSASFEPESWVGVSVDGDSARVAVQGRFTISNNTSPRHEGFEEVTRWLEQVDMDLRLVDGDWRIADMFVSSIERPPF